MTDEIRIRQEERERCARVVLDYASSAPAEVRGWLNAAAEAVRIRPASAEPEGMVVVDLDAFFSDAA